MDTKHQGGGTRMGGGSGLGDWLSETLGRFTDPDGYSIKQEFVRRFRI
jgi:hypothetical protein